MWVSIRWVSGDPTPDPIQRTATAFRIANGYGLFQAPYDDRLVAVLEGSDDGEAWSTIEFTDASGDAFKPWPWPGLHVPRLDVKMNEVARFILEQQTDPAWFRLFLIGILEGRAPVHGLLAPGRFAQAPPKFVRVRVFAYRPATPEERDAGQWWSREPVGDPFGWAVMLEDGWLVPARF